MEKVMGKILIKKNLNSIFLKWFEDWRVTRHCIYNTVAIKLNDKEWYDKTPDGNIGKDGILYAAPNDSANEYVISRNKISIPNYTYKEANNPCLQFPFFLHEESELLDLLGFDISLVPLWEYDMSFSGYVYYYKWLEFVIGCPDIMKYLGSLNGAIYINDKGLHPACVGETYGSLILVNNNKMERFDAINRGPREDAMMDKFLEGNKEALDILNDIRRCLDGV